MLNFACDFWPLFWAIFAVGALLTVLAAIVIATFRPPRLRTPRSRRNDLAIVQHRPPAGSRHARKAA